jgi:hypothetical protein
LRQRVEQLADAHAFHGALAAGFVLRQSAVMRRASGVLLVEVGVFI